MKRIYQRYGSETERVIVRTFGIECFFQYPDTVPERERENGTNSVYEHLVTIAIYTDSSFQHLLAEDLAAEDLPDPFYHEVMSARFLSWGPEPVKAAAPAEPTLWQPPALSSDYQEAQTRAMAMALDRIWGGK